MDGEREEWMEKEREREREREKRWGATFWGDGDISHRIGSSDCDI